MKFNSRKHIHPFDLVLNFGNNCTKRFGIIDYAVTYHVGEQLLYDGILYEITQVKHDPSRNMHELFLTEVKKENPAINDFHYCMYCGEFTNETKDPTDLIHYQPADVEGIKYTCPVCDSVITETNKFLCSAIDARKKHDKAKMIAYLEQARDHLDEEINKRKAKKS